MKAVVPSFRLNLSLGGNGPDGINTPGLTPHGNCTISESANSRRLFAFLRTVSQSQKKASAFCNANAVAYCHSELRPASSSRSEPHDMRSRGWKSDRAAKYPPL